MLTEKQIARISKDVDDKIALIEAIALMRCFLEPAVDMDNEWRIEYFSKKMQEFLNENDI